MQFISENWKTIVAIVALIQPWLIWTWKNYVNRGKLDFFTAGRLEIGYSNFASTLGINGSIRAINKDFYVREVTAELTKEKDNSKHHFKWAILRDTNLNVSPQKIELPYGFIVSVNSPYRINVQLHDLNQQETLTPIIQTLETRWNAFVDNHYPQYKRLEDSEETYHQNMLHLFNEFKTDQTGEAHSKITKECYWQEGNYSIVLSIHTSKPTNEFKFEFKFELTELEAYKLELNTINMIDIVLQQPERTWFFVFPQYRTNDIKKN